MKIRPRPQLIPGIAAAATVIVASAATLWSAKPLYNPMVAEFGWQRAPLVAAGVLSVAVTAVLTKPAGVLPWRFGIRALTLGGSLASGILLLLALPNLTHFWQLVAMLVCLGVGRALILGGSWNQLRHTLSAVQAMAALLVCCIAGAAIITPWIAQIVYRNSWREGAAACGGLMLLIASPVAYLLLPGSESEPCR